jgi:hypothetical protein
LHQLLLYLYLLFLGLLFGHLGVAGSVWSFPRW